MNSSILTISNTPSLFTESNFTYSLSHSTNLTLQINATDADSDTLTYSLNNTAFTINSTGHINKTNSISTIGTYNVSCNITDSTAIVQSWIFFNITNIAPVVTQPTLNDTVPYINNSLNCTGGAFSDADSGDTESSREYKWYNGTAIIAGQTSQGYNVSDSSAKGDILKCSVRVSDGDKWSLWKNSTNSATIQNTRPSDPTGASLTGAVRVNDKLEVNCSGSTDEDADEITYHIQYYNIGLIFFKIFHS